MQEDAFYLFYQQHFWCQEAASWMLAWTRLTNPKQSVRFGSGRENDLTASFRPTVLVYMIIHRPTAGRRRLMNILRTY